VFGELYEVSAVRGRKLVGRDRKVAVGNDTSQGYGRALRQECCGLVK